MKKLAGMIICLVVAASASFAAVGINWSTINGVAWSGASADVLAGSYATGESLLDRYNAIWQLIYAGADNAIDDPSTVAGGANGDYVTDDDVVWAQREIQIGGNSGGPACSDGTTWDNWLRLADVVSSTYVDMSWNTAGFVYQRIFEGTPAAESYYYQGSLLALDLSYAGGTAFGQELMVDSTDSLAQPTSQFPPAVPEPATMGLLGLGALVMAIRRRRA